jgi:hypothetical protein
MGLRTRIANLIDPTQKNSRSDTPIGRQFLRYGNSMTPNWSQLVMNEEDKYTGFGFATIHKRAVITAQLAINNLKTDATKSVMEAAKQKGETVQHPYLKVIDESVDFSNYDFWYNAPTYLDLRGLFYVGVIRNVSESKRTGAVQSFQLLNPYKVERVIRMTPAGIEVGGYREWLGQDFRDWPVRQIIEMRRLNPFDPTKPYSVSDASKDSQFTLKEAGDSTRQALRKNRNSPGIYSTDVVLEDDKFDLFTARIRAKTRESRLSLTAPAP